MLDKKILFCSLLAVLFAVMMCSCLTAARAFETGADMSELAREEQLGTVYKDMNGNNIDAVQQAENEHWSCCRLRLWVNPSGQDIMVNNLSYTVALAKRIKSHGMKFILDIHYSDSWADPGHQTMPSAWSGQSYSQLLTTVKSYTQNVVSTFNSNGVLPDYVQVGNEINGGFMWPTGSTSNYSQFIGLIKAGIAGVKAVSSYPQIIIHIANGGSTSAVKSWFDKFNGQGVSYDIIGLSYYPPNGTTLSDINSTMAAINGRYGKKIMIVEFSYFWGWGVTSGNGYWNTPTGQAQCLWALTQLMRGYSNGDGVIYWGATYVWNGSLSGNWAGEALWNSSNVSLPAQGSLWAQ